MLRRGLITGIGVLSPIGQDRNEFCQAVLDARSGIERIEAFDPSPFRTPYGGEVRGFEPLDHLKPDEVERFSDRYIQLALAAARQAIDDAGLSWSRDNPPPKRTGLAIGTCNGGLKTAEEQYEIILRMRPGRFDHKMNLLIRYHAVGKALSYSFGLGGPAWVVTTACSSSTAALALALEMVTQGKVDTVLAGGADALCLATMAGFDALKATSTDRTAPFSHPPGLNLGEGAAFWVIEEERTAKARGAKIEGELLSYTLTADAHHPTAPHPRGEGAFRTMKGALKRAGVSLDELGCISAHGTGTEANDRAESKALSKLMGERSIPVCSTKSQVGHCLGAAGIIEATANLMAMQKGVIPATINFSGPRPGCHIDCVPNTPRKASYDRFLSCNYAFGGNNACVVVGKYDSDRGPVSGPDPEARSVLTGGGAVTSLGLGMDTVLEALQNSRRGLVPLDVRAKAPTRAKLAGLVPDFTARDVDRRLNLRSMDLISRYATAAARLALMESGIRVGPQEGLETGVVNGVYVGPGEEGQMLAVIPSRGAEADISVFSHIVANSTAGWVSTSLLLKGYATTVAQGADAGLFALLLGHFAVTDKSAPRVLAGASDELFSRYLRNYDELDLLHVGEDETHYRLRLSQPDRRVLGEGSAYVLVEEAKAAKERGAKILAELAGYGMNTDWASFYETNLQPDGLARSIAEAIQMAGWRADDVGLVLWTPQGNRNDQKALDGLDLALGSRACEVPLVTSVFHTGLCESASGTITLAAVLASWARGEPLWTQITGTNNIDRRPLPSGPVPTLVIATSELGFNLTLALAPWQSASKL